MRKFQRWLFAGCLLLASVQATAHPFHDNIEPVSEAKASILADRVVTFLVGSKKLPLSWQNKQLKTVRTRDTTLGTVWVVVFENPEESNASRSTLFIFLDELGNPISANFDGKL